MNKAKVKKLHQLYRRVPSMDCKGLCVDQCTIIGMAEGEAVQLAKLTGKWPSFNMETKKCGYLVDGRCTVYDHRPMVCRVYGAASDLVCEYGCRPATYLSPQQGNRLLDQANAIAGQGVFNITESQAKELTRREQANDAIRKLLDVSGAPDK